MMMLTVSPKAKPVRASFWVARGEISGQRSTQTQTFEWDTPYWLNDRGDAGISEPQGFGFGTFLGREAKHETRIQPVL